MHTHTPARAHTHSHTVAGGPWAWVVTTTVAAGFPCAGVAAPRHLAYQMPVAPRASFEVGCGCQSGNGGLDEYRYGWSVGEECFEDGWVGM